MDTMIKNPDTGRMIKVRSALGYKKSSKVYQKARDMVMGQNGKPQKEQVNNLPEKPVNKKQILKSKIQQYTKLKKDKVDGGVTSIKELNVIDRVIRCLKMSKIEDTENVLERVKFNMNVDDKKLKSLFGDGQIMDATLQVGAINRETKQQDQRVISTNMMLQDAWAHRMFGPLTDIKEGETKWVSMQFFMIFPGQPKGSGTKIFTNQVTQFKKMGYERLYTHAAGHMNSPDFNGYYTWARLGYDFKNKYDEETMLERIQKRNRNNDKQLNQVKSLPQLMSFEKGRKWWREFGFPFDGVFDMRDGSKSMLTLQKYNEGKKNVKT